MTLLAGSVEIFGCLARLFGVLMRPAAAALAFAMLVAIFSAHISSGSLSVDAPAARTAAR